MSETLSLAFDEADGLQEAALPRSELELSLLVREKGARSSPAHPSGPVRIEGAISVSF